MSTGTKTSIFCSEHVSAVDLFVFALSVFLNLVIVPGFLLGFTNGLNACVICLC